MFCATISPSPIRVVDVANNSVCGTKKSLSLCFCLNNNEEMPYLPCQSSSKIFSLLSTPQSPTPLPLPPTQPPTPKLPKVEEKDTNC